MYGPAPHLPVELLLVLHPHELGERVVVGVELVVQDHLVDRHVRRAVADAGVLHGGAVRGGHTADMSPTLTQQQQQQQQLAANG